MEIEYNWLHTGHTIGSSNDVPITPAGRKARHLIEAMVNRKMTWESISNAIRVDRQELDRIQGSNYTQIPAIKKISYQTVYYAMRKEIKRRSQLDRLLSESLEKWGHRIEQEDGQWHYDNTMDHIQEGMFAFCFITKFQKEVNTLSFFSFFTVP